MAEEHVDKLDFPISLQESSPPPTQHSPHHASGRSADNLQPDARHHPGEGTDQHVHFSSTNEVREMSVEEPAQNSLLRLPESSNEEHMPHSRGESAHPSPQHAHFSSTDNFPEKSGGDSARHLPQHLTESSNEESTQHSRGESAHPSPQHAHFSSADKFTEQSLADSPRHSPQQLSKSSTRESLELSRGESAHPSQQHAHFSSADKFTEQSQADSPRHSPRQLSKSSSGESLQLSRGESAHRSTQHAHFSSEDKFRETSTGELAHHPLQQLAESSRDESISDSLLESTYYSQSRVPGPRHSPRHSLEQTPAGPSHGPSPKALQHSGHNSSETSASAHNRPPEFPQHSQERPRPESPYYSTSDFPRPHQQDLYSVHDIQQHFSIKVPTSTSDGRREEEEEVFYDTQGSIRDTIFSTLSSMATAALDFILPPLPPEPSPSEVASTQQVYSNAALDSSEPRRSYVASARDHDELSTAAVHEVVRTSEHRKATGVATPYRSRGLSERFFQKPIHPEQKVVANFSQGPYHSSLNTTVRFHLERMQHGFRRGQLNSKHTIGQYFFIAYQTLGVVYGDLGTSPLYVYPTINVKDPQEEDFLGILSLIFWTLTLIGVLKYSLIVLQADDYGEGGTFALYSLLCQHANIRQHQGEDNPVQDVGGRRLSHMCTQERQSKHNRTKDFLENSRKAQHLLLFVVMMGTCMIIGDGILTPAISVMSAIEGIKTAAPNLSDGVIVAISAFILVLLFFLQRFGTNRVSLFFSPVMAIWFITTPMLGVYNIIVYYPTIFKAVSPAYIVYFFQAKGKEAWLMLGGTVLCITGAEAMYADMGHFNKHSIQIAFCLMVYPSVLLTYTGQTAFLIKHPYDHRQGFFKMIPQVVFWPMFVISTLAAIVASQGLISATFSIIKQSVALDYFPRVKLVHTSEHKEGQIYSPEINFSLMVLCLAVIFGFRSSATIGNAFGVAVTFVMFITTCLMSLVMLVIWGCRVVVVVLFFILFLCVEGVYISSVVVKVPQGGWLPFAVALVVTLIMFSWNMGCQAKYRYEMANQISKQGFDTLLNELGSVRVPGICFFYTDLMGGVPPIVQHYVSNVRSFHRVLVFTTVRFLPVKTVLPSERFLVARAGFDGVYRCVARYGYRDMMKIQNNEFLDQFLETLKEYIESKGDPSGSRKMLSDDEDFLHMPINVELTVLERAKAHGAIYVMGRGELKVSKNTKFTTRFFVGSIYRFLRANCRSEVSAMDIPYANYLEIGMLYHI